MKVTLDAAIAAEAVNTAKVTRTKGIMDHMKVLEAITNNLIGGSMFDVNTAKTAVDGTINGANGLSA